jgi:hypothetical protein
MTKQCCWFSQRNFAIRYIWWIQNTQLQVLYQFSFSVVGCPANANLRQNYSCKSKSRAQLKLRVAHLFM